MPEHFTLREAFIDKALDCEWSRVGAEVRAIADKATLSALQHFAEAARIIAPLHAILTEEAGTHILMMPVDTVRPLLAELPPIRAFYLNENTLIRGDRIEVVFHFPNTAEGKTQRKMAKAELILAMKEKQSQVNPENAIELLASQSGELALSVGRELFETLGLSELLPNFYRRKSFTRGKRAETLPSAEVASVSSPDHPRAASSFIYAVASPWRTFGPKDGAPFGINRMFHTVEARQAVIDELKAAGIHFHTDEKPGKPRLSIPDPDIEGLRRKIPGIEILSFVGLSRDTRGKGGENTPPAQR